MHINVPLQPNPTGEHIKFGFYKTSMTFRSLNPVPTLLASVYKNDVKESTQSLPPVTQPAKLKCVLVFSPGTIGQKTTGGNTLACKWAGNY